MGISGFERNKQALEEEKARQDRSNEFGANAPILYLRPGQTMVRVLPPYSDAGLFFNKVSRHRVKTGDDIFFGLCPSATFSEDCAICDKGAELYETKDERAMEIAKELKPKANYLYNVICFSAPADKRGESPVCGKVYVMESGVMVHRQILELDQDEATGWADITNIQNGVNLVVRRTGSGLDTKYQVHAHGGGRTDIRQWLVDNGINPDELTLFNLEEVYNRPDPTKLAEVAARIRVPGTVTSVPQFRTAAPASPAQPMAPVSPPPAQPSAVSPLPQPVASPVIPSPPKS